MQGFALNSAGEGNCFVILTSSLGKAAEAGIGIGRVETLTGLLAGSRTEGGIDKDGRFVLSTLPEGRGD